MINLVIFLLISQTELITNGGFEQWTGGIPDNWQQETSSYDIYDETSNVHSSTHSVKLVLKSESTQRLTQYIYPVTQGHQYVFSFFLWENDTLGKARPYLRFYDAQGSLVSSFYGSYSTDSPNWVKMQTDTIVVPQGADTLHAEIRLYNDIPDSNWTANDSAIFYVDDASLMDFGAAPEPPYHSIYDIQGQLGTSPYADSAVKTSGIVTGVFGNNFFIEEYPGGPWRGIYVYRGSASSPQVQRGDSVVVRGTVSEYYGNTEIKNITGIDVLSAGHALPNEEVITTDLAPQEQYESVLARIENATCTNDSLGYGEWEINNFPADPQKAFRVDDLGVSYLPTVGYTYTITGPITYSFGNFKIEPRDMSDIQVTDIEEKQEGAAARIYITQNGKLLKCTYNTSFSRISIFNIYGRTVIERNNPAFPLDISNLPEGIYTVVLNKNNSSFKRRLLVIR